MEQAVSIEFRDVSVSVRDRKSGNNLQILKGVSGRVEANHLLAIMGSSGAGKTTLLDVLACNTFGGAGGGSVTGQVLVNGAPRSRAAFTAISSYVLQRDVLEPSSTVREAITLSALLKLPRAMPAADKAARVDGILAELDLLGCQHTLIGDEMLNIKGISGGQRRRVAVGIELVKSPRVLFLDEPTSGLDSEMAVSLIETLVALARQNRTVCTTIHQPNSLIVGKFDDFMLLSGGACVYYGVWAGAVDFFAANGFPCPQYQNPTDFFMSVLKDPEAALGLQAANLKQQQQALKGASGDLEVGELMSAAGGGSVGGEAEAPAEPGGGKALRRAADSSVAPVAAVEPNVPWLYQAYLLSGRMLRMWVRNPMMLLSEGCQYAFMAVFCGLVYLQLNNSVATGVTDRAASLWFAMAVLSFTPSYTAAVAWDRERLLLRRESSQGMYSVTAWFAAKTATTTPVEICQTTVFCIIMYFMVGYVNRFINVIVFIAVYCLFQLTSESIGSLSAITTGNSTYAVLVLTFVLLFLLSFSGFLVSDVPVYFRWIQKISFLTYAYAAVAGNEFLHTTYYYLATPGGDKVYVSGAAIWNGEAPPVSVSQINNGLSVGVNVAILFGICVFTRCLAFLAIYVLARLKRL